MPTVIDKNLPLIKDICADHSVRSLFLFGSLTKGGWSVERRGPAGRFWEIPFGSYADNMLGFEEGLKKALKSPIDLTTARFMRNRFFIQSVEESKILLYSMEKETLKLLEDIRMAADIIDESLERLMGKERNYFLYEKDLVLQGSVERRLLIVGEALTKLRKVNPAIEVSHSSKIDWAS